MAEILLGGRIVLLDDADLPLMGGYRWQVHIRQYVIGQNEEMGRVLLHRLIMAALAGIMVDHVNGDGFDNRRVNLRFCSPSENACNKRRLGTFRSRYKGVHWDANSKNWRAQIRVNGRRFGLGSFVDERLAAQQYDRHARLLHGEFAKTNHDLGLL